MRPVLIADCETTSLTPDYATGSGVIWELALIERGTPGGGEHLWRMKPDLSMADPGALRVGRFYERTAKMCTGCTRPDRAYDLTQWKRPDDPFEWSSAAHVAAEVAVLLDDATLVAANPAFDAGFLTAFLKRHGQAATWHYRLRDIGSMAAGYLAHDYDPNLVNEGLAPQIPALDASTDEYAMALGVDLTKFERHSALGDCRLVAAMLNAIGGDYL